MTLKEMLADTRKVRKQMRDAWLSLDNSVCTETERELAVSMDALEAEIYRLSEQVKGRIG